VRDRDDTDTWPGVAWMGLVVGTLAGSIMTLVVLSALARGQTNLSFGIVGVLCMQPIASAVVAASSVRIVLAGAPVPARVVIAIANVWVTVAYLVLAWPQSHH
jgi:hypothetical protein